MVKEIVDLLIRKKVSHVQVIWSVNRDAAPLTNVQEPVNVGI